MPDGESLLDRMRREADERAAAEVAERRRRVEEAAARSSSLFSDEAMLEMRRLAAGGGEASPAVSSSSGSGPVEERESEPDETFDDSEGDAEGEPEVEEYEPEPEPDPEPEYDDESDDSSDDESDEPDASEQDDDEDFDPFEDDFGGWDNNPFIEQNAEGSTDAEDWADEEDLEGLADEQREIYDAEEAEEYARKERILASQAASDNAYLDEYVTRLTYPTRNPVPMSQDTVELREDRPFVRPAASTRVQPPEPLKFGASSTSVRLPNDLVDTIRAVVIESLQSSVTSLDASQLAYLRKRVGVEAFEQMGDTQRVGAWIEQIGKNFAGNRVITAFLAAHANLDVLGLDETTSMIVDALRGSDPVLREMHTISAKLDSLNVSNEKTRSLNAYNNQTLRALELAVSFIIAYFLPGYLDLSKVRPTKLNIANKEAKTIRDQLLAQTKKEIIDLKWSDGRPTGPA